MLLVTEEKVPTKERKNLLFIDILRVIAVTLVVLDHLIGWWPLQPYHINFYFYVRLFGGLYGFNDGSLGVAMFVFISGFSLMYTSKAFEHVRDIGPFYINRLKRIYPMYWLSLWFTVMLFREVKVIDWITYILGFNIVDGINGVYWFLTPLLELYALFPLLSYAMARWPHVSILSLLIVEVANRYYGITGGMSAFYYVFIFGFGMYLARMKLYPKISSNKITTWLGRLSFPAFLVHVPLMYYLFAGHENSPLVMLYFIISLFVLSSMMEVTVNQILRKISHFPSGWLRRKHQTRTESDSTRATS
jgi:peptidoglycan/LPS O-acetylase OafA/YrhL